MIKKLGSSVTGSVRDVENISIQCMTCATVVLIGRVENTGRIHTGKGYYKKEDYGEKEQKMLQLQTRR